MAQDGQGKIVYAELLISWSPLGLRGLESRFAAIRPPPIRSDFKSHDSNRKTKNLSNRC